MKQIKNYQFTTGCWIFVLATIFALNSKITLAMDTPCKEASHTLGLSKHKIDFNSLINSADKERIEIHFFWTTGRPYDWLKDEHEADRTVNIGGNRWSRKFQSYIQEFLKFVPQKVNISFTCDQLTAKSNATLFNSLSSNFGKRFQLRSWESLTTKIYAEFPEHKLTLKRFFDQGFCGNPAISSDVYRLVGMPIAYGEEDTRFDKTMWVYT